MRTNGKLIVGIAQRKLEAQLRGDYESPDKTRQSIVPERIRVVTMVRSGQVQIILRWQTQQHLLANRL